MIFSLIFEGIKTAIDWGKQKSKAKHDRNMAKIHNETRLLLERESNNSSWSMANLNNKDKIIRMGAFLLFASPILGYWISPALGARVQEGWNQLTPLQAEGLRVMSFAVFGVRTATNVLGSLGGAVIGAFRK